MNILSLSAVETAKKIAAKIDGSGYNVSKSAGNWLQLKTAVEARNTNTIRERIVFIEIPS